MRDDQIRGRCRGDGGYTDGVEFILESGINADQQVRNLMELLEWRRYFEGKEGRVGSRMVVSVQRQILHPELGFGD